jgi:crossover junction endodeoxyribonuclease RuvC
MLAVPPCPASPDWRRYHMRIIGIDPGLNRTGYGVVDSLGTRSGAQVAVEGGVCKSRQADPLGERILAIYSDVCEVLDEFKPTVMALEQLHSRYQFPKTAIMMGHVRGAICLAAAERAVPVVDYAPTRVKNVITGSGRASKEQMQMSVAALLSLPEPPNPDDVADAFALAICHSLVAEMPAASAG